MIVINENVANQTVPQFKATLKSTKYKENENKWSWGNPSQRACGLFIDRKLPDRVNAPIYCILRLDLELSNCIVVEDI